MAKVGVVIVCYNSGILLERCLACLAEQTLPADRILIMDNRSSDPATLACLETVTGAEVHYLEENLGYGGAINRALTLLTDEDFLCCLNPDAFPDPHFLEKLLAAAQREPSYGSYAPLMLKADNPALVDGAGDVLHVSGIPWRRFHGRPAEAVTLVEEPVFSACAGAALYRLDLIRNAGGFDASFFMYVEDVDLGFRLLLRGHPCLFVPTARVLHVGSATTGRDSDFTVYHGHRNLALSYFKNMPLLLLLLTLPLHLLVTIISLVIMTTRGQGLTTLRAKKDALVTLPGILAKRQSDNSWQKVVDTWQSLEKWSLRPVRLGAADRSRAIE